jgi:MerR family copper efflux transcriptional regulator
MTTLTIGQLAQRVGLHTSTLRYYEELGLLKPVGRNASGYRLYNPDAEQILLFIQCAQRLGFSLADIKALLQAGQDSSLSDEEVTLIAERRYMALEQQITELLILRHELELFLGDLNHLSLRGGGKLVERVLERVCPAPLETPSAYATLEWLLNHTGCSLISLKEQSLLEYLRGRHVHIWQESGKYQILVVGHDPKVEAALRELARMEAECHAHPAPSLKLNEEGYLFTAEGKNAFIFARLFLALEMESVVNP